MTSKDPLPTRASLIERVRDRSDDASWEEFYTLYRGLLLGVARRARLDEHEAEEAVQEMMITVAQEVPDFTYDPAKDSFKGWLLQIARWRIVDQFRKRARASTVGRCVGPGAGPEENSGMETADVFQGDRLDSSPAPDPIAVFDAIWELEWERHLLSQALTKIKRRVNPEHYAIYHRLVIEDRTVAEVRQSLGVTTAQVYLAKHRVGRLVKQEVQRLRADEIQGTSTLRGK